MAPHPNRARPPAIGAGAANGFGLRDMVGLVWEWTRDFDAYATTAESRDADGKDSALTCGAAAAGASDLTDYPGFMRFSLRSSLKADYTADNLGFRCAGDSLMLRRAFLGVARWRSSPRRRRRAQSRRRGAAARPLGL